MSLKDLPHEKAGMGATLIVLVVVIIAMVVIGVIVWMRRAPTQTPTQPSQAVKPHSELQAPYLPPSARPLFPRSAAGDLAKA